MRGREERTGELLAGKYRLGARLGAGGMGVVYEAINTWTDRRVAVKLLQPRYSSDAETIDRFRREAKSAGRISHPSIVEVLDLGIDPSDGSLYMVQEFLTGKTLREHSRERAPLSVAEAAAIMAPIMDGLAVAHEAGVIHRDVKPENIILAVEHGGQMVPKLIDFGISKITASDVAAMLETGRVLGTPLYMSPEQLRADADIDARTDVWAVGVVLFELLAGRRPFEAPTHAEAAVQILTTDAPPLRALVPEVPAAVANVVARALARDREARTPTMRALHDAFAAATRAGDSMGAGPRRQRARWQRWAVVAAVITATALIGVRRHVGRIHASSPRAASLATAPAMATELPAHDAPPIAVSAKTPLTERTSPGDAKRAPGRAHPPHRSRASATGRLAQPVAPATSGAPPDAAPPPSRKQPEFLDP
jgi:serine/threonine-protein kinase